MSHGKKVLLFYATFPGGSERNKRSMSHETRKFEFLCDMARQLCQAALHTAVRTDSKAAGSAVPLAAAATVPTVEEYILSKIRNRCCKK